MDVIPGARDLVLALDSIVSDMLPDGCVLEETINGRIEGLGSRASGQIDQAITALLAGVLGTSATGSFGLNPATLARFSDAAGMPDDDLCHNAPFFGGRRHSCAPVGGVNLCDILRIEPRRFNFRPDGIEIVMAEDLDDPQFPLMVGKTDPFAVLMGQPPTPLCQPGRYSGAGLLPFPATLAGGRSIVQLVDARLRMCGLTEPSCGGICPQTGTRCSNPMLAPLGRVDSIPGGAECVNGVCCAGTICAE